VLLWTYWERNLFLVVNECDSSWLVIISWNMSWQWSCLLDFAGILFQSIPFSDTWSIMVFHGLPTSTSKNDGQFPTYINIYQYQHLSGSKSYKSWLQKISQHQPQAATRALSPCPARRGASTRWSLSSDSMTDHWAWGKKCSLGLKENLSRLNHTLVDISLVILINYYIYTYNLVISTIWLHSWLINVRDL